MTFCRITKPGYTNRGVSGNLEFAILVSWQHQMTHHGIDQSQQTIAQFVQFCECLESTEQIPSGNSTKHEQENEKDEDTHRPHGRNRKCGS